MKRVTVRKYYSNGRYHDPLEAQEKLEKLQERHPDRDYSIMTNMRGGASLYVVVQHADVTVDIPDIEKDLGIGPPPDYPKAMTPGVGRGHIDPAWTAYENEVRERRRLIDKHMRPITEALRGKLNP